MGSEVPLSRCGRLGSQVIVVVSTREYDATSQTILWLLRTEYIIVEVKGSEWRRKAKERITKFGVINSINPNASL